MDRIIDVTENSFDIDVIEQSFDVPVVVDFWAPWCGPCHMLSPILERLASDDEFEFVLAKVNVDDNPALSMEFQVQGIPAVKAFVDGSVVAEFVGVQQELFVRQFLRKLIPDEVDQAIHDARSLLATHHWADAEAAFRHILGRYPQRADVNMGLARALLAQGEGCEALDYLNAIREGKELAAVEQLRPLANFLCYTTDTLDDLDSLEPLEAQFRQAGHLLMRGNFEAALDGLLDILRQDKRFRKGEPKNVVLGLFTLLGDDNTLTQQYRTELASVLF